MEKKIKYLLVFMLLILPIASAEVCKDEDDFFNKLSDTCKNLDMICSEGETPFDSDCSISTDAIMCEGDRCIYSEFWFAKLLIIVIILMLVFHKPEYDIFLFCFTAFLFITYGNISIPYLNLQQATETLYTNEAINSNIITILGSYIYPSRPFLGFVIGVVLAFITVKYITRWHYGTKYKGRYR
jgi:hypothetical protein